MPNTHLSVRFAVIAFHLLLCSTHCTFHQSPARAATRIRYIAIHLYLIRVFCIFVSQPAVSGSRDIVIDEDFQEVA